MFTMIAKRSVAASDSGKRALPELDRVHRRDREAERRQLVGRVADGDRAVLQPFEKRALRLERNAVDLVEQDDFGRRERSELGDQRAGRRVDHLEPDDFGRLQIGAPLEPRELRVADRGEDHAEEGLADAGDAAQQQVAGVDLPLFLLVVGRRDFREQDDIGERLRRLVADERLAAFGDDRFVKGDGFFEIRVHVALLRNRFDNGHQRLGGHDACQLQSGSLEELVQTPPRSARGRRASSRAFPRSTTFESAASGRSLTICSTMSTLPPDAMPRRQLDRIVTERSSSQSWMMCFMM